ncbi:MAG: outer membrane lipoprotein-sorting protein [Fidelibacterota bacterium]
MKYQVLPLLFCTTLAWSQDAQSIIDRMTATLTQATSRARMTQTVETTSGKTRTLEFEMFSADSGSSVLIRYIKPSSVKGQSFLMLNDANDIWTYFPRTRRVRKLASSAKNQKVQGSDFSYSDFSSSDTWQEDYISTLDGSVRLKDEACWKLTATETEKNDSDYPRVVLFIRKSDYSPLQMDFYNENNQHEKTLTFENITNIEGVPTAMRMIMENVLEGSKTVMEIKEMTYAWTPPKGFFSERNLQQ